jgi:hypothetical protein
MLPLCFEMSSKGNYEYSNLMSDNILTITDNNNSGSNFMLSYPTIFVLCETCHWCATYFNKTKLPNYKDYNDSNNKCPQCAIADTLSSFPILDNESFTFNYSVKRGVELEFKRRTQK